MKARDITTGMPFRFVGSNSIYIAMGNGWHNTPEGYSGGPWCEDYDKQQDVEPLATTLNPFSFMGLAVDDVLTSYDSMTRGRTREQRTDGDRAITRRALTDLGLDPAEVQLKLKLKLPHD